MHVELSVGAGRSKGNNCQQQQQPRKWESAGSDEENWKNCELWFFFTGTSQFHCISYNKAEELDLLDVKVVCVVAAKGQKPALQGCDRGVFHLHDHPGIMKDLAEDMLEDLRSSWQMTPWQSDSLSSGLPFSQPCFMCLLLQAFWRYLWDSKNAIPKNQRPHLFGLLKAMVYGKDEDQQVQMFGKAMDDAMVNRYSENPFVKPLLIFLFLFFRYPKVKTYLARVFEDRESWAICYRKNLPLRGNNTNNYCEVAMRILKDKIFFRSKAFNIPQMLDFLTSRMEAYYEQRLIGVASNSLQWMVPNPAISDALPPLNHLKSRELQRWPSECQVSTAQETMMLTWQWHGFLPNWWDRGSLQTSICCLGTFCRSRAWQCIASIMNWWWVVTMCPLSGSPSLHSSREDGAEAPALSTSNTSCTSETPDVEMLDEDVENMPLESEEALGQDWQRKVGQRVWRHDIKDPDLLKSVGAY